MLESSKPGPAVAEPNLPAQLTSFVGREAELNDLRRLVNDHRLVTLTGPGGVGKTRLGLQLAGDLTGRFAGGRRWVDLAPITDPNLVSLSLVHASGLANLPGHSAIETLVHFIGDREMLVVLDNCEHLLDACAPLITALLGTCVGLKIVATSREPIGVAGELTWATPTLSLADSAVELFLQRARLVRPDCISTDDDVALAADICRRLDGVPLAIELAATRMRSLSLIDIRDGLSDRLQLLTSGLRTSVPRQQTLRASEDWSHALLDEPERVVFRRLAVFSGGFDLDAALATVRGADVPNSRTANYLAQLVEKSLVIADNTRHTTRYRMLETVRQYALEKLDAADETNEVRSRHRDHYTALFGLGGSAGYRWQLERAEIEINNLRAAFTWDRERDDFEAAARLASSLLPLWIHSRTLEGLSWFNAILADGTAEPVARAWALTDKTILEALAGDYYRIDQAEQAVAIARDLDNPALLGWALAACGFTCRYSPEIALPYFAEALELSSAIDDDWRLSQILGVQAYSAYVAGDPTTVRLAAGRGRDLADAVGDWSVSRLCRLCLGLAQLLHGDPGAAAAYGREVATEAAAAGDPLFSAQGLTLLGIARARQGDAIGSRTAAEASIEASSGLIGFYQAVSLGVLVDAALAAGDVQGAIVAVDAARNACALPQLLSINGDPVARATLAAGDATTARRWNDETLSVASGVHRIILLETRIRAAIAEGDTEQAEQDARDALAIAAKTGAYLSVSEVLECLATLATDSGSHREAAKLFGSAAGIRERTGMVRYKIYDADYLAAVDTLRNALGDKAFDDECAAGAALSTAEAITNALRGRTKPKRPSSGWSSLTPAERNVARLVGEGLRNKDIAAQLVISTRTVETHLTRIYAKLNLSSRVQLAHQSASNM